MDIRNDADMIISAALRAAQPDTAVKKALAELPPCRGKLVMVAVGKAAWQMAKSAHDALGARIHSGVVITKYGHSGGALGNLRIREAAHPVPDENSYRATQEVIGLVEPLRKDDLVLFLLSGGGSALFEKPLVEPEEMESVTGQLLAGGAEITEINTIRKRLSAVKGGKFALLCSPARVFSVVLSDIIGDPLDMIASGPACPDSSSASEALAIAKKYALRLSPDAQELIRQETPKALQNVMTKVTGSVTQLCREAEKVCAALGYRPTVLTTALCCEAKEAGSYLAGIARENQNSDEALAFIAGGETVVHLTGSGLGGRNQELALSAARGICGMKNTAIFSVGSDGTDGPTDAAGGYVDGETAEKLSALGMDIAAMLQNNDSYHALKAVGGLIVTGPTGTNVNDLTVLLLKASCAEGADVC